jgi:hypothetical protein
MRDIDTDICICAAEYERINGSGDCVATCASIDENSKRSSMDDSCVCEETHEKHDKSANLCEIKCTGDKSFRDLQDNGNCRAPVCADNAAGLGGPGTEGATLTLPNDVCITPAECNDDKSEGFKVSSSDPTKCICNDT